MLIYGTGEKEKREMVKNPEVVTVMIMLLFWYTFLEHW